MGDKAKTVEKKENNPFEALNVSNVPVEAPVQMQRNHEAPMMQQQGAKMEINTSFELMGELKELDDAFSRLDAKERIGLKVPKGEGLENANFVERYQSRNALVKKMSRAVRIAKTKISQANQELGEEELEKLKTMVEEAKTAKKQISDEDQRLKNWKTYTENEDVIDEVMDKIVEDSWFTDSGVYKDVVEAIKRYKKDKNKENFKNLQKKVHNYIEIRTEHGTKGEERFRPKGRTRIRRMKDLAARLGLSEHQEAYRNRAQMDKASKIQYQGTAADDMIDQRTEKLKNANEKLKEAIEIESKFDTLKAASGIIITAKMLDPEYIMGHLDEMKHYAKCVFDVKTFITDWNHEHMNQEEGVKSPGQIFEEKVYQYYVRCLEQTVTIYEKLEDYIKACETGDQEEIQNLREIMTYNSVVPEEGKELCRKHFEWYDNHQLEAYRLEYIVGAYGETAYGGILDAEKGRLAGEMTGFNLNAQGRFASEKDRANFEKDLKFMDALYNGSTEDCFEVLDNFINEIKDVPMDESVTSKEYIKEHFTELYDIVRLNTIMENMITIRPDVKKMFDDKYGKDYSKRLDARDGGLGAVMSHALKCFGFVNGFATNTRSWKRGQEMEYVAEAEKGRFEEQVDRMLQIIKEHKSLQQEK